MTTPEYPSWVPSDLAKSIDRLVSGSSSSSSSSSSSFGFGGGAGSGGGMSSPASLMKSRDLNSLKDYIDSMINDVNQKKQAHQQQVRELQQQQQQQPQMSQSTPTSSRVTMHSDGATLASRWGSPSNSNSKLLSGCAVLKHLPGAQYCIDAGLHPHHCRPSPIKRPQSARPAPPCPCDSGWVNDMEAKLRALRQLVEQLILANSNNNSGNDDGAKELYRLKYAVLIQKLDEMNELHKQQLAAERERQRLEELDRERREKEMLLAYERQTAKMVLAEREKWSKELEAMRDHYERDRVERDNLMRVAAKREMDRLIAEWERERAQWETWKQDMLRRQQQWAEDRRGLEAEVARLMAELDELKRRLHAQGHSEGLAAEIDRLQRLLREKDAEIARLRQALEQQLVVEVKQDKPNVQRNSHEVFANGGSIWPSGSLVRTYLGQKKTPVVVGDIPAPQVSVKHADGQPLPPHLVKVVTPASSTPGAYPRE